MTRKKQLSKTHLNIIEKLKDGWFIAEDQITLMCSLRKIDRNGIHFERINKNSLNSLVGLNIIEKAKDRGNDLSNVYILKGNNYETFIRD